MYGGEDSKRAGASRQGRRRGSGRPRSKPTLTWPGRLCRQAPECCSLASWPATERRQSGRGTERGDFSFGRPRLGAVPLADIRPELVERLLNEYSATGVGPANRNRMRVALSSVFSFARRAHIYSKNPCADVAFAREPRGRDRRLTPAEIARLLAACRQSKCDRLYLLVVMALGTGARVGELVGKVTWEAISWSSRTVVATLVFVAV